MTDTSTKYQDMLSEVEMILSKISATDMDLDDMVQHVERGYSLIQSMQERLASTKLKIEEINSAFEGQDQA